MQDLDIMILTKRETLRGFAILANEKAYEKVQAAWAKQVSLDEPWSMAAQVGWRQALVMIPKHLGDPEEIARNQARGFQQQFPEFNVGLFFEGKAIALN